MIHQKAITFYFKFQLEIGVIPNFLKTQSRLIYFYLIFNFVIDPTLQHKSNR